MDDLVLSDQEKEILAQGLRYEVDTILHNCQSRAFGMGGKTLPNEELLYELYEATKKLRRAIAILDSSL